MRKYPEDLRPSLEDFRASPWKKVMDHPSSQEGYSGLWQSLSSVARESMEGGSIAEGKVLWLLADACSMMLNPSSMNEPFKPMLVTHDGRSALPEDFTQADIEFLATIAEEISEARLRGRIADLIWLLATPRKPQFALLAIDAYRTIPLRVEAWLRDGRECWERAITLTKMLGKGASDRRIQIETDILTAFQATKQEDGFFSLWLSNLLAENSLGREQSPNIAEKLKSAALRYCEAHKFNEARSFFEAAAQWFKRAGNNVFSTEMLVGVAETWAKDAAERTSSAPSANAVAASFYENAIHTYRRIPHNERPAHVNERIAELHRLMGKAGQAAVLEMGRIKSDSIDITKMVEAAQNAVRGKSATDALANLANLRREVDVTELRTRSQDMLNRFPLQNLFASSHLSRDGRIIAKRPGLGSADVSSVQYQETVWAQMVRNHGIEVGLVVQGILLPALRVVVSEHRVREADLIAVAHDSNIVPPERERLFGKALFLGFEMDFVGAIHLLAPQIEHMVRWHLKLNGIRTTMLDQDGIENENGLSSLMELPETTKVFGENLCFELRALFCDPFGPNLRNELAHGLLDDDNCESLPIVYAWWLGFRIVFNTFWNRRTHESSEDSSNSG